LGDTDLFLSIAEIAGVFVGFGALISFSTDRALEARVALRGVVIVGLVVLAAALLPVWLARYGVSERALWGSSSAGFLLLTWIALVVLLRDPDQRATSRPMPRRIPCSRCSSGCSSSCPSRFHWSS
jgi:hypothetical protein